MCKELTEDQFRGFINVLHFTAVVSVFASSMKTVSCSLWSVDVAITTLYSQGELSSCLSFLLYSVPKDMSCDLRSTCFGY